jgi:hypothetical protein
MLHLTFFVCIFFLGAASQDLNRLEDDGLEVAFVTVLYRHGDRTPIDLWPSNPYKDPSNW